MSHDEPRTATFNALTDLALKALAALAIPASVWALNLAANRAEIEIRLKHLEAEQARLNGDLSQVQKTLEALDTTAKFILRDLDKRAQP